MSNELAVRESVKAEISGFEMKPRTLEEAMKFCEIMANSDLVPKDYRGKPGNIMVAIQMGNELGMTPMRSLRSIAVINGRASQWGDDMLAMVLASPVCEWVHEQESTDEEGVCEVKRRGDPKSHRSTFSLADAKRAGLLGKQGSWQTNTSRMLKLRARGFALRDKFTDVLAGLITAEEAMDLPPVEPETPALNMLEANQPLTLKDKLRAKVELIDEGAAGVAPVSEGAATNAQLIDQKPKPLSEQDKQFLAGIRAPSTPEPTGDHQPYLDRIALSQSVRECSETINAGLADSSVSVFGHTAIQEAGKKKIVELRKK